MICLHFDCTFPMCNPNSKSWALHASEPDGRGRLDPNADKSWLKPARLIVGQHHFRCLEKNSGKNNSKIMKDFKHTNHCKRSYLWSFTYFFPFHYYNYFFISRSIIRTILFHSFSVSSLTCSVLALSHPAQQGEQLAAVANTQTQCVVPLPEVIKFSLGLGVICNSSSPTLYERQNDVTRKKNMYL